MRVTRLELRAFRSYGSFTLDPSPVMTVLVGPNAVGKTNLMEAVQLVTATESFRHPEWRDVVEWGKPGAVVDMRAEGTSSRVDVRLEITAEGTRTYLVNGQRKRRQADVAGLVPSIAFTPEDLSMVKGPAEKRRAAVDALGDQISAAYAKLRRDYGKVLRHRNALLKEERPTHEEMRAWDDQLVALGSRLTAHRARLVRLLSEHAAKLYSDLAGGEVLGAGYEDRAGAPEGFWETERAAEEVAEHMRETLLSRAADERARQVTLVGPHRDDVAFEVDGKDARRFASQGQQRTTALAWKMAEVRVVEQLLKRKPLLLLDDVMSELDEERRTALVGVVQGDVQTFVTTTNLGYFDDRLLERATVVRLGRTEEGETNAQR